MNPILRSPLPMLLLAGCATWPADGMPLEAAPHVAIVDASTPMARRSSSIMAMATTAAPA